MLPISISSSYNRLLNQINMILNFRSEISLSKSYVKIEISSDYSHVAFRKFRGDDQFQMNLVLPISYNCRPPATAVIVLVSVHSPILLSSDVVITVRHKELYLPFRLFLFLFPKVLIICHTFPF
jgi:hypothetical protein